MTGEGVAVVVVEMEHWSRWTSCCSHGTVQEMGLTG